MAIGHGSKQRAQSRMLLGGKIQRKVGCVYVVDAYSAGRLRLPMKELVREGSVIG